MNERHEPQFEEYAEFAMTFKPGGWTDPDNIYAALTAANAIRDKRFIAVLDDWMRPDTLRLRAGEMTPQELRTVLAVLGGLKAEMMRVMEGKT